MKDKIKLVAWFLAPIILLMPQFIIGDRYETAKSSGYEIDAVVVDYETETKSVEYSDEWEVYVLYVDYEVDGKEYKNIKSGEFTEYYGIGETVKVVVNPENPGKIINDGDLLTGLMSIAGFFIGIFNIVILIKSTKEHIKAKKEKKNQMMSTN